jgi:methylphosphotriester-DNA--protein-cysteine methyltransferase
VSKTWTLLGADGQLYQSSLPGTLGGHRRLKIYGRLDCASALRFLAKGHYANERVFFLIEDDAKKAGYRPCARCMPQEYASWKRAQTETLP